MQNGFSPKEVLRLYMENAMMMQDVGSLLAHANRAWSRLFQDSEAVYWVKNAERWLQIKPLENGEVRFERGQHPWHRTADELLRTGNSTHKSFSDGLLVKLFCGKMIWGVILLSPFTGELSEEQIVVLKKLANLLSQQLLPMLEKVSPRDTALQLLRKDALILLAEEIQAPLSIASAAAQTVEAKLHYAKQAELEEKCGHLLRVLDQNLRKAMRISDNVLEVGRLENGYAQPEWQSFDVNSFLKLIFDQVVPYAASESVDFFYQSTLNTPQIVTSDAEYVERILLNLISNAIKGCRRCGRRGEIHVTAALREEQIVVTVRDNGVGISREDLPHVFEKFWQPSNAHGELRGTGIGLHLSYLLTQQLNGKIWAESAMQGACFTLCIPKASQKALMVTSPRGALREDVILERLKTELCEFIPVSEYH